MPTFEIMVVGDQIREWSSERGGPMKSYRVGLRDEQGQSTPNVEWARKATSPPPVAGQKIEGTLDTSGQYGPKFKATPSSSFGGGRGRDPKESAQIVRQHSQEMALMYAALRVDKELLPEPFKLSDLKAVINWFEADAKAATP